MFLEIRRLWNNGRFKVTIRLFLFELSVVVVGVLIAQWVANYAQRQSAYTHMEEERSRALYELQTAHDNFRVWLSALPCLNSRLDDVMKGKPLAAQDLRRPSLRTPNYQPPSADTLALLGERYGLDEKNAFQGLNDNITSLISRVDAIIGLWGRLNLLDPVNGPVKPEDRAQARLASVDIKAQLRSIEIATENALRRFRLLKILARNNDEPGFGPAHSCDAIWRSGRMDPPLSMP